MNYKKKLDKWNKKHIRIDKNQKMIKKLINFNSLMIKLNGNNKKLKD